MNSIQNHQTYCNKMSKTLIDKIFFMDKIDCNVFIDFGCADGQILHLLSTIFPENFYIGFDFNQEMIRLAKEKGEKNNLRFTSDWNDVALILSQNKIENTNICLILLSVIHEVYSYGPENISNFWNTVFNTMDFKFIVIRDMAVSRTASRPSDPISVARIRQIFNNYQLDQWEAQWGSLEENWSLTHFLLTYHYQENWEREYKENYLPITREAILAKFPKNYFPKFVEHYTLPYIREKVEKDFGIQLQERTHFKLIMEKK